MGWAGWGGEEVRLAMRLPRRAHVRSVTMVACIVFVGLASGRGAVGAEQREPPAGEGKGAAVGRRVILENVDRYRVNEPLFEAARVVLSYRGETYSPAYVQGISGAAFRIGGPCECAPTCEWAMSTDKLIDLFGYEHERLGVPAEGPEREVKMGEMIERVRDEIRAGRPAIVWHAFTYCENDVVCGFDEETGEFYGRASHAGLDEYARAHETRPLEGTEICGGPHAILIGEKTGSFDARAAEIAALREAVLHAHGASGTRMPSGPVGIECYDAWIAAYRNKGSFMAPNPPNAPYLLSILQSTRRAASDFMAELAPKYPEGRAHLEAAAGHFARESVALKACADALAGPEKERSQEQYIRAAGHLGEARAEYVLAMKEIARALRRIEPVSWALP